MPRYTWDMQSTTPAAAKRGMSEKDCLALLDVAHVHLLGGDKVSFASLLRGLPRKAVSTKKASRRLAVMLFEKECCQDGALAELVLARLPRTSLPKVLFAFSARDRTSPGFLRTTAMATSRDFAMTAEMCRNAITSQLATFARPGDPAPAEIASAVATGIDWLARWLAPADRNRYLAEFGPASLPRMALAQEAARQQAMLSKPRRHSPRRHS